MNLLKERKYELGNSSIAKLLWYYSLPTLIGTLTMALYNVIDRIYIGQGVGAMAISGLSLTFPLMNLLGAFGMLVGHGAAAQVSLYLGQKESTKANDILFNTFALSIFIYVIVSILSLIFLDEIIYAFGGSENTITYAREYMKIIIPGHIFTSLSYAYTNIMRASGHPMLAMKSLLLGAILNIILDPIFIFLFDLGIKGAAYATVLSMFISSLWITHFFFKKGYTLNFDTKRIKIDPIIISNILSIGLSSFLLHTATSLVNVLMNHTLQKYGGDLAIGAFGIMTSFTSLIVMAIVGMAQGMQPILGYNYGAGQLERVRKTLKYCTVTATIITTIGCLIAILFPSIVVKCFTNDNELINIATQGFKIYASTFFVVGFHIIITNYFQSIGKAGISIFLSLTRQLILLIPFIFLLPPIWGLNGAWMAQPISNITSAIVAAIILVLHIKKHLRH